MVLYWFGNVYVYEFWVIEIVFAPHIFIILYKR